jgi:hypothetical protein
MSNEKKCMQCGVRIRGRSDKKFCEDACRNAYNNLQHRTLNKAIRRVNSILKSNRRILEKLFQPGEPHVKVPRKLLMEKGFKLNYLTNLVSSSMGSHYYFCYEYGLTIKGEDIVVVKRSLSTDGPESA